MTGVTILWMAPGYYGYKLRSEYETELVAEGKKPTNPRTADEFIILILTFTETT